MAKATVKANIAGSAPTPKAILIANGTNKTVAPTLDITNVKMVAMIAKNNCIPHTGKPSITYNATAAKYAAAPDCSMAIPRGIKQASKNTVCQDTAV